MAVILILVLSAIIATVRGFVREVLSIIAWIGAAAITFYAFPMARPWLREWITIEILADIVTGAVIFTLALIVLSSIAHLIARGVRGTRMSALDRSLGFLFGVARGGLIVSLAFILLVWLYNNERPAWMAQARSAPLAERGAAILLSMIPPEDLSAALQSIGRAGAGIQNLMDGPLPGGPIRPPPPAPGGMPSLQPSGEPGGIRPDTPPNPGQESGYNETSRGELDRLTNTRQ